MWKSRRVCGICKGGGKPDVAFHGFHRPSFPRLTSLLVWLLSSAARECGGSGKIPFLFPECEPGR